MVRAGGYNAYRQAAGSRWEWRLEQRGAGGGAEADADVG
jgi:hypothetical protein